MAEKHIIIKTVTRLEVSKNNFMEDFHRIDICQYEE